MSLELRIPRRLERRVFEDAVAYRFAVGQSLARIQRLYRVPRKTIEAALARYMNRRRGR